MVNKTTSEQFRRTPYAKDAPSTLLGTVLKNTPTPDVIFSQHFVTA